MLREADANGERARALAALPCCVCMCMCCELLRATHASTLLNSYLTHALTIMRRWRQDQPRRVRGAAA